MEKNLYNYNIDKAQEEANKLKQIIGSGKATNYSDAEKLVEQEDREEIASQIGLSPDSNIVKFFISLNKEAREGIIASVSDQVIETFGENYLREKVARGIFKSLNHEGFADRINTPEDFRLYAEKVMEVAKNLFDRHNDSAYHSAYDTADTVANMIGLIREDFDQDLNTLLQMMGDDSTHRSGYERSIFSALSRIGGIFHTSKDLEHVGQFVELLSEKGYDAKNYIYGLFGENSEAWQEVITDSTKLNDTLSLLETAFTYGVNQKVFIKKIYSLSKGDREQFIQIASKFATKDIPPQFVLDNISLLQDCDFSKDGLAFFTSIEAQKKWLEYCVQVLKYNPQNIESLATFFNEALASEIISTGKKNYRFSKIKGLSEKELADIQELVDEEFRISQEETKPNVELRAFAAKLLQSSLNNLYKNKKFEVIVNLQSAISLPELQTRISSYIFSALLFERADFKHSLNLAEITKDDYRRYFEIARKHSREWQGNASPFQDGAEIFGYKQMLEYIRRKDLRLHDAVHHFRSILGLFEASGLSNSEFYGQILQQVRRDNQEYEEGTAHHHLNAIAQTVNKNVAEVIAKAKGYEELERFQQLLMKFSTPQEVFASWANLKKYSELNQLLGKAEVLDALKQLKAEGKEKLYNYVVTLAFHPNSKVNMSSVIEFWRDPESFLAANASHTPLEVHDRKKTIKLHSYAQFRFDGIGT